MLIPDGVYQTSGDVTAEPNGSLLWTLHGEGSDALVRVDPVSKQRAVVASSLGVPSVWGLMSIGNTLYGMTRGGVLLTIDSSSGTILDSTVAPGEWRGAAAAPPLP